jgi:hypothetical protein
MKKTAPALTLALVLISVLVIGQKNSFTNANPISAGPPSEVNIPSYGSLSIVIFNPAQGANVTNPVSFEVSGYVHSGNLESYKYSVDGGPCVNISMSGLHSAQLYLPVGVHSIAASAKFFGKTVYTEVTFKVVTSPYITILSPETKTYNTSEIPLNFQTQGVSLLRYRIDGEQPISISGNTSLRGIPDGEHSLVLTGESILGGPLSTKTLHFEVDTRPPKVSILKLESSIFDPSDVSLIFTVNEATTQITYVLDGTENVTISSNLTLPKLSSGFHNVSVYARDRAGNLGSSETASFTVAGSFSIVLLVIAVVIIAVASVGLLVYLKKRRRLKNECMKL